VSDTPIIDAMIVRRYGELVKDEDMPPEFRRAIVTARGIERENAKLRAAAKLALDALSEEKAAYEEPLQHVEDAIAALLPLVGHNVK